MRTNKNREMALELREQGYTLQEIADKIGVSRARVAQYTGGNGGFRVVTEQGCVYPTLRNWMNENKVGVNKLTKLLYGNVNPSSVEHMRIRMCGKIEFKKSEIDFLIRTTGLTYEEMFSQAE